MKEEKGVDNGRKGRKGIGERKQREKGNRGKH